ncbi:hypothetical protein PG990_007043 [Apiospora arundinis]
MVPAIDDPWVQLALKVGRNGLAATASYAVEGVTPRGGGCCRDVTAARPDGVWIHAFPDGIPSPYESDRECEIDALSRFREPKPVTREPGPAMPVD